MTAVVTIQTVSDLKKEIERLQIENGAVKKSRYALSDELERADRRIADLIASLSDVQWFMATFIVKIGSK